VIARRTVCQPWRGAWWAWEVRRKSGKVAKRAKVETFPHQRTSIRADPSDARRSVREMTKISLKRHTPANHHGTPPARATPTNPETVRSRSAEGSRIFPTVET